MQLRKLACFVLSAFLSLTGDALAQRFHFERFTSAEGLASSLVFAIDQDEQGYIWVATSEGLSRFDGHEFISFDHSSGIQDQRLTTLARDSRGWIWLGTEQGLSVWDGHVVRNYGADEGLGGGPVLSIAFDKGARAWLGLQSGGIASFDGRKFRRFGSPEGLPADAVSVLRIDRAGRLWIGTRGSGVAVAGIVDGNLRVLRRWSDETVLVNEGVGAFAEEPDGSMLVGLRGAGLARIDRNGIATRLQTGIGGRDLISLSFNRGGRLMVGAIDDGVSLCAGPDYRSCRRLDRSSGLPSSNVTAVFEDREAQLWIGTATGLARFPGHRFLMYTENEGLPPDAILSVMPDSDGSVWVGTYGGVSHLSLGKALGDSVSVRTLREADGLPSNVVWHTLRDRRGELWLATGHGLSHYTPGRGCRTFTTADGLPSHQILHLFESRDGALWVGTRSGVARLSGASAVPRVEPFSQNVSHLGVDCIAIAQAPDGNIWFVTTESLGRYDGRGWKAWSAVKDLHIPAITDLLVLADGTVWLATSGAGMVRFDPRFAGPGAVQAFGTDSGLPSNTIRTIAVGSDGMMWAGTPAGIVKLNPRMAGTPTFVDRRFTVEDGASSQEPVSPNAFASAPNGELWFGLIGGLTRYLPERDVETAAAPPVTIESVVAARERIFSAPFSTMTTETRASEGAAEQARVARGARDLTITYRAVSFRDRRGVRYEVRLEPYDATWSTPTARTSKEYTRLPPGSYRFLVRASVGRGSWSTPASVPVEIPARFWETTWFRIVAVAAALLALFAAHGLRVFAIRRRNVELEKLVAERTQALEEQSRELEHANIELETINEIVMEADRAKSRFLANMSHELRTPLNSIIGFADLLLGVGPRVGPEKHGRFLTNIRRSAQILLGLINDVLDISKIEAGKMEVHIEAIALDALVAAVIDDLRGLAEPRAVGIDADVDDSLPLVFGDPVKVRQIINNLISNAIKFSPVSSAVHVSVRRDPGAATDSGGEFEISVTDRGPGIPPEQLGGLFEEYRQAKAGARLGLGTGLGLAIVKNFAHLQGGRVAVESVVGEGSTFRVWLPFDARSFDSDRQVA